MNVKIKWLRDQLKSQNLQGMIVSNPVNIKYLTGIEAEGTFLLTLRENIFITDSRYVEAVNSILTIDDEILVNDIKNLSKEDYASFFMFCENVGFEEKYVTYAEYKDLLQKVDLVTQNIDSTWRFLDSDDYYDWFGGLIGASNSLGGHSQTAVVDMRKPNDLIVRSASEELELEIRSTLLNPKYQEGLLTSAGGWNAYAAKVQDLFAFAKVSGDSSLVSKNTWSSLALCC